jgi:hypothetical protein
VRFDFRFPIIGRRRLLTLKERAPGLTASNRLIVLRKAAS